MGANCPGRQHPAQRHAPGLILALLGYPLIVSWWSMLIIPITLVVYNTLRLWQEHHVLRAYQIDLPADRRGFWGYLLL
jgi:biofilm PGA synthesis N-glycosyltransferase PgaC